MKLQLKILKILIAAFCLALPAAGFAQGKITRKPKPPTIQVNSDDDKKKEQSKKQQPGKTASKSDNSGASQPAPDPLPPGLPQSMASTYRQAKQGNIQSMKTLADHYHKQGNNEQYFYWLEQAGEHGDADSYIVLGDAYWKGTGCQKNLLKAEQYLTKAYNLDNDKVREILGEVRCDIGRMYDDTYPNGAIEWFKAAAALGNLDSQRYIGTYYYTGKAGVKDIRLALDYFQVCATRGDIQSMYTVAEAYYTGDVYKKDLEKAEYWYRKAAEKGHTAAKNKLKEFKPTVVEIYDKKPGEGLIGCSVYHIRNGEKLEAWAADLDGRVTFKGLQPGDVLRFEYVGFKSKEVTIKRSTLPDKIRFTLNTGSSKKTDHETY